MCSGSSAPGKSTLPRGKSGSRSPIAQRYSRPRMVSVILHGELRQHGERKRDVDARGRTADQVVADLGIPAADTAAFVVNGEQVDGGAVLRDGDTLELLPAISGGEAQGALEGI